MTFDVAVCDVVAVLAIDVAPQSKRHDRVKTDTDVLAPSPEQPSVYAACVLNENLFVELHLLAGATRVSSLATITTGPSSYVQPSLPCC